MSQLTIGSAIFLMAIGAILKYAVTASVAGVSLPTVGVILMVAGAVGAIASVVATRMTDAGAPPRTVA